MANKITKVLLGIVIVAAILGLVYMILPAQYKGQLQMAYQQMTDDAAKEIIPIYKAAKILKTDTTYEEGFAKNSASPSYLLETVNYATGSYNVVIDGYRMVLSLEKEDKSDSNIERSKAHVRVVLHVTHTADKDKIEGIDVYLDDELQNDFYEKEILEAISNK